MEVVLLAAAFSDQQRHYVKFEEMSEGRGERFDREVDEILTLLGKNPEMGRPYHGALRRFVLVRHRLGIFYRIHHQRLFVCRLLDLRQPPALLSEALADFV